ncbi:MAG TPA: hypothetical protein H9816_04080 [Candidatus Tidjanibacter faecipullorum]|uniref:ASCH domain-containing protein n=1 Tax=Candidatus Tidjanibacter faecipullorum TaxID=2838766 RepID=A0A9D2DDV7_9BACT|nr:hypothetical protein [Candidatus Tidjanibacter faecipullorum]
MQKIMFDDRYGLTQAVIDGRKTVTRRTELEDDANYVARHWNQIYHPQHCYYRDARGLCQLVNRQTDKVFVPRYKLGEIVAVAQSYRDAGYECLPYRDTDEYVYLKRDGVVIPDLSVAAAGVTNKMFASAKQMPYRVWITGIRIERLQDISDEDCLREGVCYLPEIDRYYFERKDKEQGFYFNSPREAFAALIDKVSGKGTWNSNPFVVVYEFEVMQ